MIIGISQSCTKKSIESYIHQKAILAESPLSAPHPSAIAPLKACEFAIEHLLGKGVKNPVICEVNWIAASISGYLIDLKGNLTIKGQKYTTFRIGICDGTETNFNKPAGKEFIFMAYGNDSKGSPIWHPKPGPDYKPKESEGWPESFFVYEFLLWRDKFETLHSCYL